MATSLLGRWLSEYNESFNYSDKSIDKDENGKTKERYQANLHIVERYRLRLYLGLSGYFRSTNYNVEIKKEIDLRPIIESTVKKHRLENHEVNESKFLHDFYDGIMNEIVIVLRKYVEEKLPQKEYNHTINSKIDNACLRLLSALRIKFDYNYKYPHEVSVLDNPNAYAIISQLPFNGFGIIGQDNIYDAYKNDYSNLVATKAVSWFASYVYSLRNALFHEIISPLDENWQIIFKSAYLILKQISDICISCISGINDFPKTQENAVFDYAEKNQQNLFSNFADSIEVLDFPKMSLTGWHINKEGILLTGWFLVKLKLQNGTADDIANGKGSISEENKGFDFSVVLDSTLHIVEEKGKKKIEIRLQM